MKRFAHISLLTLSCVLVFSGTAAFGQKSRPQSVQNFQPVQLRLPKGDLAEAVASFDLGAASTDPVLNYSNDMVGLLVGSTYRFGIGSIPYNEGRELFPTVRLLGRLNPPVGRETDFPIVVELTQEDLELALVGKFVTRVVYLESPTTASPVRSDENLLSQDVPPGADPIAVAETLGQPIAVVRVGSLQLNSLGALPSTVQNTRPQQRPTFTLAQFEEPVPRPLGQLSMRKEDLTDRLQVDPNLAHRAVSRPQEQSFPRMESLADGGDHIPGAHVRGDRTLSGINPEDTVVIYENSNGRHSVQPSNRVHVYSPRFGSVRQIEGFTINEQKELATAANSTTKFSTQRRAVPTGRTEQEEAALYARSRTQLESTRGRFQGGEMASSSSVSQTKSTDLATSFSTLLLHEKIEARERVHLAQGKINAFSWAGAQGLLVRVNELALREMHGIDNAAAVFQVDDGQTVREIRLMKVADRDTASPGEIVEFTLRFENTGSETLQNITVLDSLTGRLEFLPDSAKSSVPAAFYVEPNEAGSMVLRWELKQPLKPREFGVVVFQCRVR